MNLTVRCQSCGEATEVDRSQIGQKVVCDGCGATLTVPRPKETKSAEASPPAAIRFACPACGRKYTTKPELAGKKIRCSGCGAGVRVPGAPAGTAAPVARTDGRASTASSESPATTRPAKPRSAEGDGGPGPGPEPEANGSTYLLDDLADVEGAHRPERAESVLSPRSATIEPARPTTKPGATPPEQNAESDEKPKKKKKKKKKKKSEYFDPKETLILIGGVSGFVMVLALVAWRFPDFRFMVGGLLCVIGFIVYLMGAYSLRQLVAEQGVVQALLYRFFPPYQWWFMATHWDEAKDFIAFFAAGIVAMAIGGGVIKTSPQGKRADASERAFQQAQKRKSADPPPIVQRAQERAGPEAAPPVASAPRDGE